MWGISSKGKKQLCSHLERGQAGALQTSREKSEQFRKECLKVLLKLAYVLKSAARSSQNAYRGGTFSESPNDVHSGLRIDTAGAQGTSLPSCPISLAEKFLEMARFLLWLLLLCFVVIFVF